MDDDDKMFCLFVESVVDSIAPLSSANWTYRQKLITSVRDRIFDFCEREGVNIQFAKEVMAHPMQTFSPD